MVNFLVFIKDILAKILIVYIEEGGCYTLKSEGVRKDRKNNQQAIR